MGYSEIDVGSHVAVGVLVGASSGLMAGVVLWIVPITPVEWALPFYAYAVFAALVGAFVGGAAGVIVALTRS